MIKDECVCVEGFYRYEGACIKCPVNKVWNGLYCEGNNKEQ